MTGADLATWRQQHGLSVEDAAALLGCYRSSIYRWEEGAMELRDSVQQLLLLLQDPVIYRRAQRVLTQK